MKTAERSDRSFALRDRAWSADAGALVYLGIWLLFNRSVWGLNVFVSPRVCWCTIDWFIINRLFLFFCVLNFVKVYFRGKTSSI